MDAGLMARSKPADGIESTPSEGSNFSIAFRVLSPERRRAVTAIYRFCRLADDAVDHAANRFAARASLARVADRLDRVYTGDGEGSDLGELRRAVRKFGLPRQPFDDLLEGVSWDIGDRRYADVDDLREYCYRVASTVGLLCVRVFGCSGRSCDGYARELGVALQWTNILRDVGSDLARGRVYLTRRSMAQHGLSEAQLRHPDPVSRKRLSALIRDEAAYARRCYAEAETVVPAAERSKLLSARIMAGVYRELLRRVEKAGDRVLDRRITVPGISRSWIAVRLLLRHRLAIGTG